MIWTKKHDKFALALNLSESRCLILRDILRKAKLNEPSEVEIDLRKTNQWIAKVRSPHGAFHRKTVTTAIPELEAKTMGMVVVLKKYSPWVYRLMVRPLFLVEQLQSAKRESSLKPATKNSMYTEDRKQRARDLLLQNISKLDSFLSSLGMKCNHETLHRMWRYAGKSMSNIKDAVTYMLRVHKEKMELSQSTMGEQKGIVKPIGWLHDCLRWGRHLDEEVQKPLPYFDSILALTGFVSDISPPKLT